MVDVLIRDVPDQVLAAIDSRARHLGLSRTEYLRRTLAREQRAEGTVAVTDLKRFTDAFSDLANEDVMAKAWK